MFETVFNAVLWGGVYNAYLALSDTYTRIQSELSEVPGRVIGEGHGNPLVFLPGVSHGQRSLVGYSPQGHRVRQYWSDFTRTQRHIHKIILLSSVQSLNRVWFFATPWTAAHQASLSITNSQSILLLLYKKFIFLFIWNAHLTGCPVFCLRNIKKFLLTSSWFTMLCSF